MKTRDASEEPLPVTLPLRLSRADVARLDALIEAMPMLSRNAIARQALRRGLDLFDTALGEKDETARLAALARLCGMTASGRTRREE